MSLSLKKWKSEKAKTLVGETVTKALTDMTRAAEKLEVKSKAPVELRDLAAYAGSLKVLQGEIIKTRAKCKKGIHDKTAANLVEMEKEARALYSEAQKLQAEFNTFLKGFVSARGASVKALEDVKKSPTTPTLAKAKQTLTKAMSYVQDGGRTFNSNEIEAGMQQMVSARLLIDRFAQVQASRQPAVAGGRALPATPADLVRELDELTGSIAKLKTPGGFYNQKYMVQIDRSVV